MAVIVANRAIGLPRPAWTQVPPEEDGIQSGDLFGPETGDLVLVRGPDTGESRPRPKHVTSAKPGGKAGAMF